MSLSMNKEYTGKDFKQILQLDLYRVTNEEENHNGFQYKLD